MSRRSCGHLRLYSGGVRLGLPPRGAVAVAPIMPYDALSGLRRGLLYIAALGLGMSGKPKPRKGVLP